MRAVVQDRYGSPDVLAVRDIDKPVINDGDVLVRVRAAGLHVGNCFGVRGAPLPMRLARGLLKPKYGVSGFDLAGQVEAVGNGVRQFQPGDEVFGTCNGTCAEYARAAEDKLALKPTNLTFEEAAALPTSALAALHALRDAGKVRPGEKVLISGASGGVGTFAMQIAKSFGADVTGVCGTTNVHLVRSLGSRPGDRLHARGLHSGRAALRPHPRQLGEPLLVGLQTRAHAQRDPHTQQRHPRARDQTARSPRQAARGGTVHAQDPAPISFDPQS
jgi:NADPH:quinone reductase-like Zn-dependent oxidoreductase